MRDSESHHHRTETPKTISKCGRPHLGIDNLTFPLTVDLWPSSMVKYFLWHFINPAGHFLVGP